MSEDWFSFFTLSAIYHFCNENQSEGYGTCIDENNTNVNNYATSTIHKYLNETYYNTLPQQDREKLGTKAVQEEFHALRNADDVVTDWKQKYNWNSMNVNVWLPGLSELVGIDSNYYNETTGVYNAAMQGLNISTFHNVDAQGGNQFTYFQQFNTNGGGEKLWNLCNQQATWTRSPVYATVVHAWRITNTTNFDISVCTDSLAVHPAVLYNPERPVKQTALLCLYRQIICLHLMK